MNPVCEKIIAESRDEIEDVMRRGRDRCDVLRNRLEKEMEEFRRAGMERIAGEALSLARRMESAADREMRMEMLREKRRIISKIEKDLVEEIRSSSELYRNFIITSILRSVRTGTEEIVPCRDDVSFFTRSFVNELCDIAGKRKSMKVNLVLSQETIGEPGFLLREGRTVTDARLGFVVARAVREFEAEIGAILFHQDEEWWRK